MLNFGERKDLLVFFAIGVLLVIGITIFTFILIWSPKEAKKEFTVGEVITSEITDDEIVQEYISYISDLFKNKDYEKIYSMLSKDYIEYTNMTKETLEEKCEELKLAGSSIYINSYEKNEMNGINKLYFINAVCFETNNNVKIVIREESPRNYTISFDGFVAKIIKNNAQLAENVEFTVLSEYYTTSTVEYKVKVKNNNAEPICINYTQYVDGFLLKVDNSTITPTTSVTGRNKMTLEAKTEKNYTLIYSLSNITYSDISAIVLRDVKISSNNITNLNYDLLANVNESMGVI